MRACHLHVLSSGDVAKIANTPYSQLASKPVGEDVILSGPVEISYSVGSVKKRTLEANAKWTPGQSIGEEWNRPFAELMKASDAEQKRTGDQRFTQFVSMKVTATLGDRSLTHNALVLFAKKDSALNNKLLIIDAVTNQSALSFFAINSPYPGVLLETDLRTPAVERWFSENAVPAKTGNGDVVCDLKSLSCGVASGDLK
jgi:hypothetical protein